MRVKWTDIYCPSHPDDFDDYHAFAHHYAGEVIGTVRSWGETKLVVMLDDGKVREISATAVERE